MDFDIVPYEDITWGPRLGAGSFGSVYRGSYLGIDIAIKEVLPSTEYDVHKYFEREWRIMRECRHPNIVLFLGLSKAPGDDGRVFIISEYVPRGNLRQFILSTQPFPWRLRLSFATDVARAVAYLHARQCIHRDLKGENLLITSNERVKVTDFGFARITSRNADEARRMTYCGTDGYMSPEIINGLSFDLPTDVFSLGMIFIEILSRRLVDSKTYIAPDFLPDPGEVRRRASPGCPPDLIALALSCVEAEPRARPSMPHVLARLREIELDVLARPETGAEHVGSVRLVHRQGPRAMPLFSAPDAPQVELGVGSRIGSAMGQTMGKPADAAPGAPDGHESGSGEDEDDDEAIKALALDIDVDGAGATGMSETWRTARWDQDSITTLTESQLRGARPLLGLASADTDTSLGSSAPTYSTLFPPLQTASALRNAQPARDIADEAASALTIRANGAPAPAAHDQVRVTADDGAAADGSVDQAVDVVRVIEVEHGTPGTSEVAHAGHGSDVGTIPSLASTPLPAQKDADHTAVCLDDAADASGEGGAPSAAAAGPPQQSGIELQPMPPRAPNALDGPRAADVGVRELPAASVPAAAAAAAGEHTTGAHGTHRFSLVAKEPAAQAPHGRKVSSAFASHLAKAFLPRLGGPRDRCAICQRRVGRAALQCDDCGMMVHVRCSHAAPRNCRPEDH